MCVGGMDGSAGFAKVDCWQNKNEFSPKQNKEKIYGSC